MRARPTGVGLVKDSSLREGRCQLGTQVFKWVKRKDSDLNGVDLPDRCADRMRVNRNAETRC